MIATKQAWPANAVEMRKTEALIPYARNPRTHSKEQISKLAASIQEWGWTNPILVAESGTIIAGHGRLLAAQSIGIEEVPCMVATGWTKSQIQAYVIADNRLALDAGWDFDVLKIELGELNTDDFEMGLLGFDVEELGGLMGFGEQPEPTEVVETPTPEVQDTVVSQRGQVWKLGRNLVVCGDSTEELPFDVPRFLFTDPPYGVAYKAMRGGDAIAGDKDMASAESLTRSALSGYTFDAGFVCCDWRSLGWVARVLDELGLKTKACIVWDKARGVQNLDRYHKQHEMLVYFGPYGGEKTQCGDVWTIARDFDPDHPTPKPVELVAKAIETSGMDEVYDPFLGSGTTLIAAEQLGRTCYGVEISPQYVDVVIRRWQQLTGEHATLESSGEAFDSFVSEN